jgi:serine protease Do
MRRFLLSFVFVAVGVLGGLVVTGRMRSATDSRAEVLAVSTQTAPAPRPAPAAVPTGGLVGAPDFTRVAGEAVKGVVNISSLQVVQRSQSPLDDPFFSYFFGDQDLFGPRTRRSLSLGSGVIISGDGYVVTNNHVVGENMREIKIALPDKRELRGSVVGVDPATDIALLKVPAKGLTTLAWGDSSRLQVGEWVLAIGSPFQLSQTVTAGIVSAKGRANVGFADYEDFIQTDAAINPGNSGGALVNARGELVGINTGIFSQSGGYQGIGFAVPSNLVKHVIDDLMKFGEVRRGTIGGISTIEALTPELAGELGVASDNGALVSSMARNSQAYDLGIRPGDVIVTFNGQPITDPSQLFRLVADSKIGSAAEVKIVRNGRSLQFRVPIVADTRGRK